jgi:hypothetical protein
MEEAKCKKCGSNNISWSFCNDCGYEHYAGRSDLLKDYVDLTYQKVILAIDNYVNKQLNKK